MNVDQTNTVLSNSKVPLAPTALSTSTASKGTAATGLDPNVVISGPTNEPATGPAAAIQKKEAPNAAAAAKSQVDKKKIDARKKSLKRL